jgi:hypothetical protein
MYGTVKGIHLGIKLVDLDMRTDCILQSPGRLRSEAIYIANDIVTTEAELGRPSAMAHAKATIVDLFSADQDAATSSALTRALGNLGYMVLETGEPTIEHDECDDDDIIDRYGGSM